MIQVKIKQYLSSQPSLVSLIGDRIYPNTLPDNVTYPAISYFKVSNDRPRVKDGFIGEARPRFQFNIWAERYMQAMEIEKALIGALDSFGNIDGVYHMTYGGGHESYERDVKLHHFIVDYFILFKE